MRLLSLFVFSMIVWFAHAQNPIAILEGTWQVEGKAQYEAWWKSDEGLEGKGYKFADGEEKALETLRVYLSEEGYVYEATVSSQNEGAAISFPLNTAVQDTLSFENPDHDFPKKIQYLPLSEDELQVFVKGENGSGFSFRMRKAD